ncbi:MAG TPA: nitrilase-related carbon-nitrogen hydrolase [Phycisphaerae bacterium]|nr:nitrilase-related carbon-nitrogen hydrolase [Phycisphaerae bacterium]
MVPWLVVLPRLSLGAVWPVGTLLGLVFYRIGLNWGFSVSGPLAGILIVAFSLWMGFSFRVAWLLISRFGLAAMLWAVPLTFMGQEVIRCEALPRLRISFLALGYSQSNNLWIAQIASLGGVYSLTGLLTACNAAIAYGVLRRTRGAWLPALAMAFATAVLGLVSQPPDYTARPRVPVACVQAETTRMVQYVELTRQALETAPRPAIIVLPEHTITEWADGQHATVRALAGLAREHRAHILVGAHTRPERGGGCDYDNVGLLLGPDGRVAAKQAKCVPIPFFQDGNPATRQRAVQTELGCLGIYVCYDGLFTDVPRRMASMGAEVFLVPVMDVEKWPPQERWQHAQMAPFRCIELRRCAVRAASSGVSQIIDATGRVQVCRTRDEGPGVLYGAVYFNDARTVFARGGYLLAPGCCGGIPCDDLPADARRVAPKPRSQILVVVNLVSNHPCVRLVLSLPSRFVIRHWDLGLHWSLGFGHWSFSL